MEMFFLQQATGVAATKLTPAAIRSLSGGKISDDVLKAIREESGEEDSGYSQSGSQEDREYHPSIFTADVPEMTRDTGVGLETEDIVEILKMVRGSDMSAFDDLSVGENSTSTANTTPSQAAVPSLRDMKGKHVLSPKTAEREKRRSADSDKSGADGVSVQQRMVNVSKQLQDAVKLSNELLDEKLQIIPRTTSSESSLHNEIGSLQYSDNSYVSRLSTSRNPSGAPYIKNRDVPDDSILLDILQLYPCDSSQAGIDNPSGEAVCAEWVERLFGRFSEIIYAMVPSQEGVDDRIMVLHYMSSVISRALGAQVFPVGSFTTRSYLPGGDIDVTAFLTTEQMDSWFVKVNEAMCISSMSDGGDTGYSTADGAVKRISVRNVSFINAWVKVVKGSVNGIEVDVSANQIGALYAQALVDQVDTFVGQKHLFKRSVLLIKSWCKYESPRLTTIEGGLYGAREGRLSTWSIIVMVIWIFNKFGRRLEHPLQALVGFLCYFAAFEWGRYALTVSGPVSVEDLSTAQDVDEFYALPLCGGYLPREILDRYRERYSATMDACFARRKEKMQAAQLAREEEASVGSGLSMQQTNTDKDVVIDMEEEIRIHTGIVCYSYYRRGVVNVMDPIQPKSNCAKAVDLAGYHAIVESLQRGKTELLKMCAECKRSGPCGDHSEDSPVDSKPKCIPGKDVPYVRTFFDVTTTRLQESKYAGGHGSLAELDREGYPTLNSSARQIELAMKHAELILGAIVTPEALARLIVHIIQVKGPLPVGEIGKQLQEITSNEHLSVVLKTQYKGLKKVIEGFGKLFRLGADHPFNPLVHLSDTYLAKRDECLYDEGALSELYVFDSTIALAAQEKSNARAPPSPRRGGDGNQEQQFVPLSKGGKAHSFKDGSASQGSYDRSEIKRSGSLSSASGIASVSSASTAKSSSAKGKGKGVAKAAPQVPRGTKAQQQQYYIQQQQQQQYYQQQQYQQYQQQVMYQQQYQLYMQQKHKGQDSSDGSGDDGSPPVMGAYPAYPMPPGYTMSPQSYPVGFAMPMSPQMSSSPDATGGFYPPVMALPPGTVPHMSSSPRGGSGSPLRPPPAGVYMYYGAPSTDSNEGRYPHPPGSEDGN